MIEITPLYAAILAVIFLPLFAMVAQERANQNRSIGYEPDSLLHLRVRRHGNFIEWVPFVLILMACAEIRGLPHLYLHIGGVLTVLGRLIHPVGLKVLNAWHPLRVAGNTGAMAPMVLYIVTIFYSYL